MRNNVNYHSGCAHASRRTDVLMPPARQLHCSNEQELLRACFSDVTVQPLT